MTEETVGTSVTEEMVGTIYSMTGDGRDKGDSRG